MKICGITTEADALACVEAGVDLLGVNLVAESPRRVEPLQAKRIALAVAGRATVVAVVADVPGGAEALRALVVATGVDRLQLHGDEPPELVEALGGVAFKAVGIGGHEDVTLAARYPGAWLLADARATGGSARPRGGTGQVAPWDIVAPLARQRPLFLAGGLTPDNVAAAAQAVGPIGVDVASGVEARDGEGRPRPGVKDLRRVEAFVSAVRGLASKA